MQRTEQFLVFVFLAHIVAAILKLLLVANWGFDLHYEEAQYWLWSKHIDWSYYSKPGMVAWMNKLSTMLFGDNELAVKIPAIFAGFIISIVLFLFGKRMFHDNKVALLASFIPYLMPFYYSITFFHSTDAFLCMFWLLASYFLWQALENDSWKNWLLTGLCIGMGMLSKYTAILFAPSFLIFLLLYEKKQLRNIKLWGAALITAICALPIIIWNIDNDWVSFKHVLGLGVKRHDTFSWVTVAKSLAEYVGGQIGIISPFLLLLMIGSKKLWRQNKRHFGFLAIPAIFNFTLFFVLTLTKAKAPNVNWLMFSYITLPLLFAFSIQNLNRKKWLIPLTLLNLFLILLIVKPNLKDKIGIGKYIPPKSDPVKIYIGWKELSKSAETAFEEIPEGNKFLMASKYKIASVMSFYMKDHPEVHLLNTGGRMNQLLLWDTIKRYANTEAVALYANNTTIDDRVVEQFESVTLVKEVPIILRGQEISRFYLYELRGPKDLSISTTLY